MKKCPSCNQLFSDDNYFCLNDGTTLLLVSQTGEMPTVFATADNATTQVVSRPQISTQTVAQSAPRDSSKWLFLIIGVLITALAAMGIFMFAMRGDEKKEIANQTAKTENVAVENTNRAENTPTNIANANKIVQPQINPNLTPAGSWTGDWNSWGSYRTNFSAQMNLTDDGAGKVSGQIVWTLQRTNNPKKIDKVGTSATEDVQGVYNAASRSLALKGVRKDDPNSIVILDRYNLILAENNLMLNGKSKGGNFILKR